MILGFHYHIPAYCANRNIYTTAYIGVFLDSIAQKCEKLVCFLHSPMEKEFESMDYKIKSKNIDLVTIGPHNKLYYRLINGKKYICEVTDHLSQIDVMLVRAPTPLLFKFSNIIQCPLAVYLVGSYVEGSKVLTQKILFKNQLIKLYSHYYEYRQKKLIKLNKIIVNSRLLFNQYKEFSNNIIEIKSTTLSKSDFYIRPDTCLNKNSIKVLFTGRIDPGKGIFEILKSCSILVKEGYPIEFHLAGIIVKGLENIPKQLYALSEKIGMSKRFIFHGRLKIGDQLNSLYRSSDIYVLASDFEGFPRTIWEAMANSLPVVATKVGSIPHFLNHEDNVLLINPGDINDISRNIKRLIEDGKLRRRIIKGGYLIALKNTLEIQSKKMINELERYITE